MGRRAKQPRGARFASERHSMKFYIALSAAVISYCICCFVVEVHSSSAQPAPPLPATSQIGPPESPPAAQPASPRNYDLITQNKANLPQGQNRCKAFCSKGL